MTLVRNIRTDLVKAGASWVDEEVVVDANLNHLSRRRLAAAWGNGHLVCPRSTPVPKRTGRDHGQELSQWWLA